MNKKILAVLAAALVVALGAAGLVTTQMGENKAEDKSARQGEQADATASQTANVEPAAAEPAASEAAKPASSEDPVVAKVDGSTVLRSDVLTFIQNLPPQMKQIPLESLFPMALEQVINGKIVGMKAEKTDVATDPEVSNRLSQAKEQIIRAVYVEKVIEKNLTPERVQKAYDKFAEEQGKIEEVRARHILVDKEDVAKEIIKKLADGAKFEDLAKEYSKDSGNKASGGDLGYFTKDSMVKEFADAAFAMKKGEVSQAPLKTQFGYHVIQVEDHRNREVPPLTKVKLELEAQERRAILDELLENWRKASSVETFDINGNPPTKKDDKEEEKE